jgi:hypothetical protein
MPFQFVKAPVLFFRRRGEGSTQGPQQQLRYPFLQFLWEFWFCSIFKCFTHHAPIMLFCSSGPSSGPSGPESLLLLFQIAYWISVRFSDSSVMSNCYSPAVWQARKAHVNLSTTGRRSALQDIYQFGALVLGFSRPPWVQWMDDCVSAVYRTGYSPPIVLARRLV